MSKGSEEQVLVVPAQRLQELGYFQGFTTDADRYLPTLLDPKVMEFRPRSAMEKDPGFKQLIPYVIFRYTEADGSVLLFQYTRGKGQGESRLHRKRSVGIGGHLCSDDCEAVDPAADSAMRASHGGTYVEGMRRELEEEVFIDTQYRDEQVGLINDDKTDVGAVHLGVVHIFDVDQPRVVPRESEIVDAGFQPIDQLRADFESFESWSQICLAALFPASPATPS